MSLDFCDVDIVVIGAGMVGLAFVAALPDHGLRIAILDKRSSLDETVSEIPDGFERGFDRRVSALTLASQQLLTRVGAWPAIKPHASPYTDMHVWDAEGTGHIHFSAAELHETVLGHIVENRVTQQALWQIVSQKPNVKIIMNTCVSALSEPIANARTLTLHDQQTLTARVIVAADGAHSTVRELAQFNVRQWSYEHTAIVTTVRCEKPHQKTAWQRFTTNGPLAFLPLQDAHYCSIVWSVKTEEANQLLALDDSHFMQALSRAVECRFGNVLAVDKRVGLPLMQRHATEYVKTRVVLIGDAAHTIHPLAGQGVNLGFLDAATLAEEMTHALKRGADIGSEATLKKFERKRQGNNLLMMSVMEGFKRLFEQEALPFRLLRNIGLRIVDHLFPIKANIMKHAMGLTGDLPDMVRR